MREHFLSEKDTIYMIVTDRFYDVDPDNNGAAGKEYRPGNLHFYQGGDWKGILEKLPYIKNAGFTALWISAPMDNELYSRFGDEAGYHGYYVRDFRAPNPHFGTIRDLQKLIDAAAGMGIGIILDVQINHSADYLIFPSQKYDPDSYRPAAPFDHPEWFHNTPNIQDFDNEEEAQNYCLGGLDDLAQENPECRRALLEAYQEWFSMGFVGGRIDAVVEIPPAFLRLFQKKMGKPCFGEAFTGDVRKNAGIAGTLWGMLDYPLYFAMSAVFCKGEAWEIIERVLRQDDEYPDPRHLATFLDNHDRQRFLACCGGDLRKLHLALVFIYAVRGIPVIYYGTEQELSADGKYTEAMLNDVNRECMTRFDESVSTYRLIAELNRLRKSYPAVFCEGKLELPGEDNRDECGITMLHPADQGKLWGFIRRSAKSDQLSVLCLFNNAAESCRAEIRSHGKTRRLTLAPYDAVLLDLRYLSELNGMKQIRSIRRQVSATTIRVHCNCGYGNTIYVRGDTRPLTWEQGVRCENISESEWSFTITRFFAGKIEFKCLKNDFQWEEGENHYIRFGETADIIPVGI